MRYKRLIKPAMSLLIIIALFFIWDSYRFMHNPLPLTDKPVLYVFKKGSSLSHMINDLNRQGLIDHPLYFKLWARLTANSTKLQAGEYELTPDLTPAMLLTKMHKGEVKLYAFTIVEGWTFKQLIQALQADDYIVHTIDKKEEVMARIGQAGQHPEGRFYPDTYRYPAGTTDVEFLRRAYDAMATNLAALWEQRAPGLPFDTLDEALILASIVEKESAAPEERPLIAGVFINRLIKNMRLQTDPTVIYGLGDEYEGDIRFRHLRQDNPYNTYTRRGLPPTPIAMPGKAAIQATLNPELTDYLYFVATGENGRHYFSATHAEHEAAVTKYQRYKRRKKQ